VPEKVSVLLIVAVLPFAIASVPVLVLIERPFMLVAAATPRTGVTNVGLLASTISPDPVTPAASAVATPVPRPEIPVETGKPVACVRVPDEGVPRAPLKTTGAPADPTLSASAEATPVPRPETPVDIGKPVAFVRVPDDGVPSAPPKTTGAPLDPMLLPSAVATPVPRPETPVEIGSPVAWVRVPEAGVPSAGVTRTGLSSVCTPVHVFALPKLSDATTAPVVGEIVSVLSLFETELTAADPVQEPHVGAASSPLSRHWPDVPVPAKIASALEVE